MGWTFSSALLGSSGTKKVINTPNKPGQYDTREPSTPSPTSSNTTAISKITDHIPQRTTRSPSRPKPLPPSPSVILTVNKKSEKILSSSMSFKPSARIRSILGSLSPTLHMTSSPSTSTIQITSIPINSVKTRSPSNVVSSNLFPVPPKRLANDLATDPLRKKARLGRPKQNSDFQEELTAHSYPPIKKLPVTHHTPPPIKGNDLQVGELIKFEKSTVSNHIDTPLADIDHRLRYVIKGCKEYSAENTSFTAWSCAFEPNSHNKVAVCGLNHVLFLDTEEGRYTGIYVHPELNEMFYAMAWTTLGQDNVLAVAGLLGSIKLIDIKKSECYRYLLGHSTTITDITFSKKRPSWLFTASQDHTVRLWDIGTISFEKDNSQCLAKFVLPASMLPTSLSVSFDLSMVLVGMDSGDMVEFEITGTQLAMFSLRANEKKEHNLTKTPLLTIGASYIYPKGDEWHEGHVDGIYVLGQDGEKENPMNNKIVSRAAEDMEMIIWDPYESTNTDAAIDISLQWPESENTGPSKFKVLESGGHKMLVAGDYHGKIRIYNIGNGKRSRTLSDNSKEQFFPDKTLADNLSCTAIRDVCCSDDNNTIVAINSEHTVYVWTAADP